MAQSNKMICLTDETGTVRWFQQDDLEQQLAGADMSASGALKAMVRNFNTAVRAMRDEQNAYFKAGYGTTEKVHHLARAKALEAKVDGMSKTINHTLTLLT